MVNPNLSFAVSVLSVLLSGTVAWLTLLRQGTIRMTKPTIVCFAVNVEDQVVIPKIYLRTLLYCTAKRGIVIENMFVNLNQSGSVQTFSVWSYRDKDLRPGCGVFISMEGVAHEHHFEHYFSSSSGNSNEFSFLPGNSVLEVFALTVGSKHPLKLAEVHLSLTEQQATALATRKARIWFNWNPALQTYSPQLLARL